MDKKMTIGNYTGQTNKDFPLDCELFNSMQDNTILLSVLGNIAGDKTILKGCEPEKGDTSRKPGYVFLRTREYPDGEVLYWEGGNLSAGMYLKIEAVPVSAQGYEYPQAYTVRSLAPGIGVENYSWNEFKAFKTNLELDSYSKKQDEDIAKLSPIPLGVVQIWAGEGDIANIPENYMLCDGTPLLIKNYPELHAAIGRVHTLKDDSPELFRLPDLRGCFIAGYSGSDEHADADYKKIGQRGGEKQHTLTTDEMPSHVHSLKDYYMLEGESMGILDGVDRLDKAVQGQSTKSDWDNICLYYKTHDTATEGKNVAHENRPPYYTLAYIMRVR